MELNKIKVTFRSMDFNLSCNEKLQISCIKNIAGVLNER